MTRSTWMKLIALVLTVIMVASLFAACTESEVGTEESSTEEKTEAPTSGEDSATEPVTETETVSETVKATETETESVSETDSETETETEEEFETTVPPDQCTNHSFRNRNGKYLCIKCGYQPACKGDHPYVADFTGHWRGACEICGKAAGQPQNHEYTEKVVDEGDLLLYSFRCTVCNYVAYEQEVPYEINAFYSAGDLSYGNVTGLLSSFGFDNGVGYAKFSSTSGGAMSLIVMENGEAGNPSGRYLVMKVRMAASQSSFSASISSVNSYSGATQSISFKGLKSGWVTLIVDITKAAVVNEVTIDGEKQSVNIGYHPDEAGDYYLSDFIVGASAGPEEHVDIAYIMFCDSIEDAKGFTSGDKLVYTYNDILNEDPVVEERPCYDADGNVIEHKITINADGTHTIAEGCPSCGLMPVTNEPHNFVETIVKVDGVNTMAYACSVCGCSKYGDGIYINKILGVDFLTKPGYQLSSLGILTDENTGREFVRFQGQNKTGQIIYTRTGFNVKEEASAFSVGTAKYFIIRLRVSDPSISFQMMIATYGTKHLNANGQPIAPHLVIPVSLSTANEWATYVVDLSAVHAEAYVADGNGNYLVNNFYVHVSALKSDQAFDLDFMAFVDNWDEVAAIVSDETCVKVTANSKSGDAGVVVDTKNPSCKGDHNPGKSVITIGQDGTKVYTTKCIVCEATMFTTTVPANVNFFGTLDMMNYYHLDGKAELKKFQYDATNGIVYNSVTVDGWQTHINITGGDHTGTTLSGNFPVGKYLVIKYRLATGSHLTLAAIGSVKGTSTGSLGKKESGSGEWEVAVIDMSDILDKFTTADSIHMRFDGKNVDIAYTAIVDNFDELKGLVTDETFNYYGKSFANPPALINTATGECVKHAPGSAETSTNAEDATVYTIKCITCGSKMYTTTVPAGVAMYGTPDWITDLKLFTGSDKEKTKVIENGEFYASIKGSQEIAWARAYADSFAGSLYSQENPFDIGNSQYMVIKIRSDKALNLYMTYSTQGCNADDYVEFKTLDEAVTNGLTDINSWQNFYDHNTKKDYRIKDGKIYTDSNYTTEATGVTFKVAKTNCGKGGFSLPLATVTTGEWHVFVIDLSTLKSSAGDKLIHQKAEGADTYVVDFLYGLSGDGYGSRTLDIAYLAFAEDWADIDGLVEEKTVLKLTNQAENEYTEVNADGTEISESGE